MRLRHNDWKKLLAAVAELYSDADPKTLDKRAVAVANKLVAGDITAFDFFTHEGVHTGEAWYDPPGSLTNTDVEILTHVVHEHPFVPDIFGNGRRDTMQTNDYLSPASFRKTAIYNEFYSRFPVHHQLMVPLSLQTDLLVTCTINRKKTDFSEEERLMFNLIAPHLTNAIRTGRKMEQLFAAEHSLNSVMASKASGVASIGADGRIEYVSAYARKLIEKYFGHGFDQGEYLREDLQSWLVQVAKRTALEPANFCLTVKRTDSTLSISRLPNEQKHETILIFEERQNASPGNLAGLGLTKRQTEVLFWIAQGKTDKDISLLLSISPLTVHKHAENIYMRLGVETRTAAMLRAVEHLYH